MSETPQAIIFWEGQGWHVASCSTLTEVSGPHDTLDLAIRAAHAEEVAIRSVAMTRGAIRERREERKA